MTVIVVVVVSEQAIDIKEREKIATRKQTKIQRLDRESKFFRQINFDLTQFNKIKSAI